MIQDAGLPTSQNWSRENHGDDTLVVRMTINQCVVEHILVDTCSSINVLFRNTLNQMGISWDRVLSYAAPLAGFSGQSRTSEGKSLYRYLLMTQCIWWNS